MRSPLDGGRLRGRLAAGEATVGTFLGLASPAAAEVCAAAGPDWLVLDLEHGGGGEEQIAPTVLASAAYGVPTVVRVEADVRIRLGRVLDLGAAGVMLPRMESAGQVAEALRHLRYPPAGDRGVAAYTRAGRFGLDPGALERANDELLCVVQIESAAAVAHADAIAALDGADVLFVGPSDLGHDLGVPGDLTAAALLESLATVRAAAGRHGKACGLLVGDGAAARRHAEEGWCFMGVGSDSTLLADALGAELAAARTGGSRGGGG